MSADDIWDELAAREPIDARTLRLVIEDQRSWSRRWVYPLLRPVCNALVVVVVMLRRIVPGRLTAHGVMDALCVWFLRRCVSPAAGELLVRHFIVETNLLVFVARNTGMREEVSLRPQALTALKNRAVIVHDVNVYEVLKAVRTRTPPRETLMPSRETHMPPRETRTPSRETRTPSRETHTLPRETHTTPRETRTPLRETHTPPRETRTPTGGTCAPGLDTSMLAVEAIDAEPRTRRFMRLDIQSALCLMNVPFALCLSAAEYRRAVHSLRLDTHLMAVLADITGDPVFRTWAPAGVPVRVDSRLEVPRAV
jgi:hypothetical protein